VKRSIQHPPRPGLLQPHKSNSLRRRPGNTHGETTAEAEAFTNSELAKIENWAKQNEMQFNELKSQIMLIARKKKSHRENINIYLNNRRL
jgi:hypothetical protein